MKNGNKAVHALTKLITQSVSNYILIKRLEYIISNQASVVFNFTSDEDNHWGLMLLVSNILEIQTMN